MKKLSNASAESITIINETFASIEKKLKELNSDTEVLDEIIGDITSIKSQLETLSDTVSTHTNNIGTLNTKVSTLETKVSSLETRVTALETPAA